VRRRRPRLGRRVDVRLGVLYCVCVCMCVCVCVCVCVCADDDDDLPLCYRSPNHERSLRSHLNQPILSLRTRPLLRLSAEPPLDDHSKNLISAPCSHTLNPLSVAMRFLSLKCWSIDARSIVIVPRVPPEQPAPEGDKQVGRNGVSVERLAHSIR